MAKGGNTGAFVILSILALGGLGLGGYTFVNEQFLGGDEHTHDYVDTQGFKLVGLWNTLTENTVNNPLHNTANDFLVEFDDMMVLDTTYVNVINSTRFSLPTAGLYKINIIMILGELSPGYIYWIHLRQNNSIVEYLDRFYTDDTNLESFCFVSTSVYLNSTGDDSYYEINPYSSDNFDVGSPQSFNQLSIEYIFE
ncbi:MAG: hypothetical protein ACTSRE_12690 [Promethearchaeota archaeon]